MTTGNPQPHTPLAAARQARGMSSVARSAAAGATAVTLVVSLGLAGCGSATAGQPARSDAGPARSMTSSARPAPTTHPKRHARLQHPAGRGRRDPHGSQAAPAGTRGGMGRRARRLPARPAPIDWPTTRMSQDSAPSMLGRAPFTVPNPGTRRGQLRGVGLAVAWLA